MTESTELAEGAPDLIEPLVGFRSWRVERGALVSTYTPVVWREAVMCAQCLAGRGHRAPHPSCGCGLSAYREPPTRFATVDFRGVSGIVSLWGRLQAHRDHVRAEYARVEALALYAGWSGRQRAAVTSIARQLGADLVDLWGQRKAADAYGTALRPLSGSATVP
jgi:hypothetical protein